MAGRILLVFALIETFLFPCLWSAVAPACCPASRPGRPVVNSDQTVIIIWDAASKTEHFIRKASFKSDADDFGFLVPTPSQPNLDESGNEAFAFLHELTEPEKIIRPRPTGGIGCGCSGAGDSKDKGIARRVAVKLLEEKEVAGFHAVVLETKSANDLVNWLKDHGYAFSPEMEAWAKPYVEAAWKITALKVVKDKANNDTRSVAASALRLTFKTDRPLFPYREPDYKTSAQTLGAGRRLLRIYLIADARYQGELTKEDPWTGKVAWANKLSPEDRMKVLELLKLPETTGPTNWWLTEFEDQWPYQVASGDVYFSRDSNQNTVKPPPIIEYVSTSWPGNVMVYAIAALVVVPRLLRRFRPSRSVASHS
jgi:hypothetical protein